MVDDNDDLILPQNGQNMLAKLLPPLILIIAIGGFVSLAIYAYKAGSNNAVQEGDLTVVEADASPMKEKPQDPGGMQFPNQDKTVFEAISGDKEQPAKVERVLPTPEEPLAPTADGAETQTWINDKLAKTEEPSQPLPKGAEQVFGDEKPVPVPEAKVVDVQEELGKQAVSEPETSQPVTVAPAPVATAKPVEIQPKAPEPVVAAPEKIKKIEPVKIAPATTTAEKPKAATAPSKGLAQLGAYKSESEAHNEFLRLQKKYPVLSGKTAKINRADLGDKGVFYRLRVPTDDAKALCAKVAPQACMAVKQ